MVSVSFSLFIFFFSKMVANINMYVDVSKSCVRFSTDLLGSWAGLSSSLFASCVMCTYVGRAVLLLCVSFLQIILF